MRVQLIQDQLASTFSKQLLDIGNGKVATGCIKLPTDFCMIINTQEDLIEKIFPNIQTNYLNHNWLAEREILASKNINVNELNCKIHELIPEEFIIQINRYSLQ